MNEAQRTKGADALTEIILTLFRVNNLTINWGDKLVAPLGLTSARWQVLGSIVAAERPQPVAWLARDLGANRQNVQRIVNDLHKEGFVAFQPNPHHRRAQLVVLTDKGRQTFDTAIRFYNPRVNTLADGFSAEDLEIVNRVLTVLRSRLEGEEETEKGN
ncbi:DNA-binding MarR family transcriptional regulator [Ochrobactrum daejeonense]|uniref:DNA-binding MarR family transcriptional regulator n=1 Tax=Brucella daejeonensis TaxID=659015 RepID=A0A7W9AZB2_9HYPH|nr:MarR family winged helix-turn-helix transcriptional regulator [Brucella daejeonensis]MBB5703383.1 DNA-binding MarR family transcriptional regulator [Brucella daejeonensis]